MTCAYAWEPEKKDPPIENIAHPFVECCTIIRYTGVRRPRFRVAGVDCDPTHYTKTRSGIQLASTCSALPIRKGGALLQR